MNEKTDYKSDTKIIEFINDLKKAIQTGEFHHQVKTPPGQQSSLTTTISNLINVDNLSNQTFSYIINWLKQQPIPPSSSTPISTPPNEEEIKSLEYYQQKVITLQNQLDSLTKQVNELIKSNEEKDKKCDELTKQVLRFKRIQDIVLTASNTKTKDIDYTDIGESVAVTSTTPRCGIAHDSN